MEINYLREFIVLAETEHYLEASNRLFISQSTLSKHIKRLEEELDVSLFNRTTRKVELNDYGRLLLPYARQIVQLQHQYSDVILNTLSEERKHIRIGSIPALAQYSITDLVVKFKQEHPTFSLKIQQEGSETLKEMLRSESCELAFIRELEKPGRQIDDEFVRIPYTRDKLAVVLAKSHPMAERDIIELSELAEHEFLLIETQTMIYDLSVQACLESGFMPKLAHTDHKVENIVDLVEKGFGTGLLMKKLAEYYQNPNVAVIDLHPLVSTQINLCYLKKKELSIAAKHFILCAEGY